MTKRMPACLRSWWFPPVHSRQQVLPFPSLFAYVLRTLKGDVYLDILSGTVLLIRLFDEEDNAML